MSNTSVEQLRSYVEQLKNLSEQIDTASDILKGLNNQYNEIEQKILVVLEENQMDGIKIPGVLNVYTSEHYSFKQPSGNENEHEFNTWLEQEGLTHLRKLNSNTLNSELNNRRKKAAEDGQLFMPPPGIDAPTIIKRLNARKA